MKRVIKKSQDVLPGDWYDEEEVIGVKDWGFAVDLRLRSDVVKMLAYDESVVVTVSAIEVIDARLDS
jgi:hypothetical protein